MAFTFFYGAGCLPHVKARHDYRQPQALENLGAVNIICIDKNGTITENKMTVESVYYYKTGLLLNLNDIKPPSFHVHYYGLPASERNSFDAMEEVFIEA